MHPYIYDVGDLHSLENGKQLYNIMKKIKTKNKQPPQKNNPKRTIAPPKKDQRGFVFLGLFPNSIS
jgi:hypothetical protein